MSKKESVIKIFGMDGFSDDVQNQFVEIVEDVIDSCVLKRILEALDDTDAESFLNMLKSNDNNENSVPDFLQEKNIDVETILKEEIDRFLQKMRQESGTQKSEV